MRFLIGILFSLFLTGPTVAYAAACPVSYQCLCEGKTYSAATTSFGTQTDPSQAQTACASACFNAKITGTWNITCQSQTVAQGDIVDPNAENAEVKKEIKVPNLSVKIPGLVFDKPYEQGGYLHIPYLAQYISAIYKLMIAFASIGVVLTVMISGVQWMMARGDAGTVSSAKESISKAVTALFILLGIVAVTNLVNPELTSLKGVVLRKIDPIPYTENTFADIANLSLPDPAGGTNGVPYFSQRDFDQPYGNCKDDKGNPTTVKTSGCGPTSFAMALNHFGIQTDPAQVASVLAKEGYRICGRGTDSSGFINSSIAKESGLRIRAVPGANNPSTIDAELAKGNLVIISVGKSRFTGGGHFMLITGKTGSDYSINDPNSGYQTITRNEIQTVVKYGVSVGKPTP